MQYISLYFGLKPCFCHYKGFVSFDPFLSFLRFTYGNLVSTFTSFILPSFLAGRAGTTQSKKLIIFGPKKGCVEPAAIYP